MIRLSQRVRLHAALAICLTLPLGPFGCATRESHQSGEMIRYGGMHETIGQQQHQGRVELEQVVRMPHFYGVGAMEGLDGEITIEDSKPILTSVTPDGQPLPVALENVKAALLVGQSVRGWTPIELIEDVPHRRFDDAVADAALRQGFDSEDLARPFMFVIEGQFKDVRLHVINGACPLHARMHKIELRPEDRPFELEAETLDGTLVGVYAADSVGALTHPATSVHVHLIYTDPNTGKQVTGHVERIGVVSGAILKLPAGTGTDAARSSH